MNVCRSSNGSARTSSASIRVARPRERPHIHIRCERNQAKFWVDTVELAGARGFAMHELNQIQRLVEQHRDEFLEAWHEYFD